MRYTMLVLLTMSAFAQKTATKDFRVSLSVSPFIEMALSKGVEYTDGKLTAKTAEELQRLFMAHGANEVYARIGTNRKYSRGFGDHSLERGHERGKMAKNLKITFNPEVE